MLFSRFLIFVLACSLGFIGFPWCSLDFPWSSSAFLGFPLFSLVFLGFPAGASLNIKIIKNRKNKKLFCPAHKENMPARFMLMCVLPRWTSKHHVRNVVLPLLKADHTRKKNEHVKNKLWTRKQEVAMAHGHFLSWPRPWGRPKKGRKRPNPISKKTKNSQNPVPAKSTLRRARYVCLTPLDF